MAFLRVIFLLLAALAGGALAALLVGWFVGMPGHWYFWAGGGAVVLGVFIALVLWNLSRGGNIIASALLACVVAVAMLQPSPARADSEARQGADWVRFTARPCTDEKVLEQLRIAGENELDFHAAIAQFQGQQFEGCWKADYHNQQNVLHYEDGDRGFVPFDQITPVREA